MNIIEKNLEFTSLSKRNSTNRIILHHTGVSALQSVEVIHNYHKNTNKWAGIGYHFYVRKDGSIYRGRPEEMIGAHAYGANSDSIGICAEGNFNNETMSEEQKNAMKELVVYLKEKYNEVQAKVNEILLGKKENSNRKSNEEMANEVIAGKWGNNPSRKQKLIAEGYDYNDIQSIVNKKLKK